MSEEAKTAKPEEKAQEPAKPTAGLKKESIWEVYYPRNLDEDKEAIPLASFPMIIYFWPAMLGFLVCGFLQWSTDLPDDTIGLWATGIWAVNLVVIVTDLDQKKFAITLLILALVGLGAYVSNLKDLGVVSTVTGWIDAMDVTFSNQAYMLMGGILWVLFLAGMVHPRFDYWRLEPNEFVHYIQPWGRDQSIPRVGSTVTREVRDVMELLLTFGGGTLVIRREGDVVARIEHVPFLGRRMKAIERMLGATRVTHVDSA